MVVADFGLAQLVKEEKTSSPGQMSKLNKLGRKKRYTVVGNPYWMAPEMIHGEPYESTIKVNKTDRVELFHLIVTFFVHTISHLQEKSTMNALTFSHSGLCFVR